MRAACCAGNCGWQDRDVAAAVAWFTHAHTLFTMTGLSFGLSNKLFDTDLVLTLRYSSKIATRLVKDVLGPVGIAFAAYGLVVAVRQRRWAEPLGVVAFVTYLIVITNGNFHHNYYQLPIVPVGVVLAALGVSEAMTRMSERRGWTYDRLVYVCAALLWAMTVSTFARSVSFHSWYEVDERRVRVCEQLAPLLDPADRVVFTNYSARILFCLHRKGWLLSEAGPDQFLDLLKKGAVIVTDRAATENVRVLDGLATLGHSSQSLRRIVWHLPSRRPAPDDRSAARLANMGWVIGFFIVRLIRGASQDLVIQRT